MRGAMACYNVSKYRGASRAQQNPPGAFFARAYPGTPCDILLGNIFVKTRSPMRIALLVLGLTCAIPIEKYVFAPGCCVEGFRGKSSFPYCSILYYYSRSSQHLPRSYCAACALSPNAACYVLCVFFVLFRAHVAGLSGMWRFLFLLRSGRVLQKLHHSCNIIILILNT